MSDYVGVDVHRNGSQVAVVTQDGTVDPGGGRSDQWVLRAARHGLVGGCLLAGGQLHYFDGVQCGLWADGRPITPGAARSIACEARYGALATDLPGGGGWPWRCPWKISGTR